MSETDISTCSRERNLAIRFEGPVARRIKFPIRPRSSGILVLVGISRTCSPIYLFKAWTLFRIAGLRFFRLGLDLRLSLRLGLSLPAIKLEEPVALHLLDQQFRRGPHQGVDPVR
jgi:hypothetical protein